MEQGKVVLTLGPKFALVAGTRASCSATTLGSGIVTGRRVADVPVLAGAVKASIAAAWLPCCQEEANQTKVVKNTSVASITKSLQSVF
ncbi:hypothetical protein CYMTET_53116 [Cymbomonas tetramitiformis]|uniref:Uncharacterized protein n=1 Tax=Cymbomonas tetramitiformis TaxID=36881 RepID=A0AAE0BIR0_9CHLO|nr:hypothetical protein CYMTET_53116 [Cymbomonas tetramitiformis]